MKFAPWLLCSLRDFDQVASVRLLCWLMLARLWDAWWDKEGQKHHWSPWGKTIEDPSHRLLEFDFHKSDVLSRFCWSSLTTGHIWQSISFFLGLHPWFFPIFFDQAFTSAGLGVQCYQNFRVLLGFWMFLACDMAFNDPRANKVLIKGPRRALHRELSWFELVWSGSDLVCYDTKYWQMHWTNAKKPLLNWKLCWQPAYLS